MNCMLDLILENEEVLRSKYNWLMKQSSNDAALERYCIVAAIDLAKKTREIAVMKQKMEDSDPVTGEDAARILRALADSAEKSAKPKEPPSRN